MKFKAGFVAIVGPTNVGKSTLLNILLQDKVSIVTSKVQTTRHKIIGILTENNYQIVFLDTPGILQKLKHKLDEVMINKAYGAIDECDICLFMIEPSQPRRIEYLILERIKKSMVPCLLIINKIDLIKKSELLPIIDTYQKLYQFNEIIPISCKLMDGIDIVKNKIVKYLKHNEAFYDKELLTDRDERFTVSEIIREKIFNEYKEEIPYCVAVKVDEFKERENKKDYIRAIIYVESASQKKILIGKDGEALKNIGIKAREEVEKILQRRVYLELWVKVREKWRKDKKSLQEFGYFE